MSTLSDILNGSTGKIKKVSYNWNCCFIQGKFIKINHIASWTWQKYKWNYYICFIDKHDKKIQCSFLQTGKKRKKLYIIVIKTYLMRWKIKKYFHFKNQQFKFEDLHVMSLNTIYNLNLFTILITCYLRIFYF